MTTPAATEAPPPARPIDDLIDVIEAPSDIQREAWARFAETGLPHRRVEGWKWSDLRAAAGRGRFATPRALRTIASRAPDATAPLDRAPTEGLPALAAAVTGRSEVFTLTADAPELDLTWAAGAGLSAGVVAVIVPEGVEARVVETLRADGDAFANVAILYQVAAGARLDRIVVAEQAREASVVSTAAVTLAEGARLRQTTVALGARLMRLETHVDVQGPGADAVLNGVSLLAGQGHGDHTTHVAHAAPHATTRETFRTVVADAAVGVFQGKIKVDRAAQKTDAVMNHGALVLSERAAAHAKPELEIYADDVACGHGATVGDLDAQALFYLRQRGLPAARARAILTRAFIAEALDLVADGPQGAAIEGAIDTWLETHL